MTMGEETYFVIIILTKSVIHDVQQV